MTIEWKPLNNSEAVENIVIDRKMVLLIAEYPVVGGWADMYHGWWSAPDQEWQRWPHKFPPTHYAIPNVPSKTVETKLSSCLD